MIDIRRQFALPTGMVGRAIGHLMALKNRERSEWVLGQLEIASDDTILEVGFGPGADIRRAAAAAAYVAGIDPSAVMLGQALRRNRVAVLAGRVELRAGAMPVIPFPDGTFNKAFSINSLQFWPDITASMRELRRVLKRGGRVAIAVQPRQKGADEESARHIGRKMIDALNASGFEQVGLMFQELRPVPVACALATR